MQKSQSPSDFRVDEGEEIKDTYSRLSSLAQKTKQHFRWYISESPAKNTKSAVQIEGLYSPERRFFDALSWFTSPPLSGSHQ